MVEGVHLKIDFKHGLVVESIGRSGGLALLWSDDITLDLSYFSHNCIDVIVDAGNGYSGDF